MPLTLGGYRGAICRQVLIRFIDDSGLAHFFGHHRRTAVRPVLTAISQSNGNGQTSTPYRIKTP